MSPTARSVKLLEAEGWTVDVVERRITRIVTRDLFGFGDLLAIKPGVTRIVQTTTSDHLANRVAKILQSETLAAVRAAGWEIEAHGWLNSKRTGWTCRRELITGDTPNDA